MTPKSDHDEDMPMEEILASIRKFVMDTSHEDAHKQRVYKEDLREPGDVPLPKQASKSQEHEGNRPSYKQTPPVQLLSNNQPPVADPSFVSPSHPREPAALELQNPVQSARPAYKAPAAKIPPRPEPDILELTNPAQTISHKTPHHKVAAETDILELTNPIASISPDVDFLAEWEAPMNPGMILEETPHPLSSVKKEEKPTHHRTQISSLSSEEEANVVSSQALTASANSLSRLAKTAKSVPSKQGGEKTADPHTMTLDRLILDMIRPMIKEWVDTNLPSVVEEMVAKEIKRITEHLE